MNNCYHIVQIWSITPLTLNHGSGKAPISAGNKDQSYKNQLGEENYKYGINNWGEFIPCQCQFYL